MDEFYRIEKFLGFVSEEKLKNIVVYAQEKEMSCLSFISTSEDTIFNQKQAFEIKKEIKQLKSYGCLFDEKIIQNIQNGIEEIIETGFSYLLFEAFVENINNKKSEWKSFYGKNMKYIIISRDDRNYLEVIKYNDNKLFTLGDILASEINTQVSIKFAQKWFIGDKKEIGFDETWLTKIDHKTIEISSSFMENSDIQISRDSFEKILKEWEEIIKKYPQKVTITQDGDEFKIEAEY